MGFMRHLGESGARLGLDNRTLQRQLLLCLFGLGTNAGPKRVCTTMPPDAYPHLQAILTRPFRRELIRQQYDQMIKYATTLLLGNADAETVLRRFTRSNFQHPTYQTPTELGQTVRTIFLCQYLHENLLRREIHDGLQVIENWNSANAFIFSGKGGEMAANR